MASRRKPSEGQPIPPSLDDINAEALDGQTSEDPSNPMVNEDRAKEMGALSADSVSTNRLVKEVIEKKRAGQKHLSWGVEDGCLLYDAVTQLYPANTLSVHVVVSGTKQTFYIHSRPRDGQELYEALTKWHNQVLRPDTEYQLTFVDRATKLHRGLGRVTLSGNENEIQISAPQQSQPMQPMPPQYGYAPTYPQQSPPQSPAPQGDPFVFMQLQKQLSDMAAQLASMQQRRDEAPIAPPPSFVAPPAPAPQPAAPPTPRMPDVPPGYALTMLQGMPVLVPLQQLGLGAAPTQPAPAPAHVAPAPTTLEQFTSTIATVKSVVHAAKAIQDLLPQAAPSAQEPLEVAAAPENNSDTRVEKLGDLSLVKDVKDGSIRPWETAFANFPAAMNWVERQKQIALQAQAQAHGQGQVGPPQLHPQPEQGYMPGSVGAPTIPGR